MNRLASLLSVLLFSASSFAEENDAASGKRAAASLLNEGNELFEQGLYEPALSRYKAAYELYPSPKLFFNMAEAHRELGRSPTAADLYERFLNEGGLGSGSPLFDQARRRLAELDSLLGRITVDCDVPGTEVFIAGLSVGKTPLPPLRVVPGQHEVALRTVGFEPHRASARVAAGETAVLAVQLSPVVATPAPAPVPAIAIERPESEDSVVEAWWFWALIGAGAIAAGVGIAVVAGSSGAPFERSGELGVTSTRDWAPL